MNINVNYVHLIILFVLSKKHKTNHFVYIYVSYWDCCFNLRNICVITALQPIAAYSNVLYMVVDNQPLSLDASRHYMIKACVFACCCPQPSLGGEKIKLLWYYQSASTSNE